MERIVEWVAVNFLPPMCPSPAPIWVVSCRTQSDILTLPNGGQFNFAATVFITVTNRGSHSSSQPPPKSRYDFFDIRHLGALVLGIAFAVAN